MIPRMVEVEKVVFSAGALKTRDLPKSLIKGLILRMRLDVTNGSSPNASIYDLLTRITKLSVVINGQDTIISVPFYHLFYQNAYDFMKDPEYTIDTTASSSVVDEVTVLLPFSLTRAVVPDDTVLDLRQVSSAVLEVTWGSASFGSNKTITDGDLNIWTIEFADAGSFKPIARHEMGYFQGNLDATGEKEFDLDYGGNNQYKRLFIYTFNSGGNLANGQINGVKVKARTFTYIDIDSEELKGANALLYGVSPKTGVYVVDFTTDGRMSQRLDARNLNELKLMLNSAVTNGSVEVIKDKAIYA